MPLLQFACYILLQPVVAKYLYVIVKTEYKAAYAKITAHFRINFLHLWQLGERGCYVLLDLRLVGIVGKQKSV